MRQRVWILVLASLVLAAGAAYASFGGGSRPDPPPSSAPPGGDQPQADSPRQEAERTYALAYEEVAKAKKDLADGKTKNAEKKLRRALERGERVVSLDPRYHEAWNLVGYTARKLGDYDKAFRAYDRCLELKPDYAPAREYLGEAYLDKENATKAREQLSMLEHYGAAEEAKNLRGQIEAFEAKHGGAPAAAPAATPASGDSATASGSGGQ
jgi:tetratricopeptide (TPR) repeat protein